MHATKLSFLFRAHRMLPGLALAFAVAAAAALLALVPVMKNSGLSALTLAIGLGMLVGNLRFFTRVFTYEPGIDFTRSWLLRIGIVLYGFRISLQDIGAVGWAGLAIGIAIVVLTFSIAMYAGTHLFGLDRQTSALIGAGSSICGAAAVMAAQTIVRGEEHKVSMAIATVVVLGTLSMVMYPLIYPYLELSEGAFGLFAGATIHEVAQVVVVGQSIGDESAKAARVRQLMT